MPSNEHPDMSGNPMDAPFLCDLCGREFKEEDAWEARGIEGNFYCSEECALAVEDSRNDNDTIGETLDDLSTG